MKLIAVFTHSGFTARLISRYRPMVPIVAFTPETDTRRRMALIWGVRPCTIPDVRKVEGLAVVTEKRLLQERLVRKGDVIGIVAGKPVGPFGTTQFIKCFRIRETKRNRASPRSIHPICPAGWRRLLFCCHI